MSRRPSAVSTVSQTTSLENGHGLHPSTRSQVSLPATRKNSASLSVTSVQQPNDFLSLVPDELFTKHTVADAKLTRKRLRDEADVKQVELRLMVGERYRDLLQASTSIISISHSSKRVLDAIEEVKDTIIAQGKAPAPKRTSLTGKNDAHLHTLQLLSAHVKLLLDTPEHLWRLIERKQYYSAAWLFLLARVVHRSLISDEQDEETWKSQGLNVLEQFPLVQRQWDAVSQFRSQIIHKATMSFREHETSAEENCAALLTLHLLDARPLSDTLSIFLTQRSKALHNALAWKPNRTETLLSINVSSHTPQTNGHLPVKVSNQQTAFRKSIVREVKKATLASLGIIFRTLTTTRIIFQQNGSVPQSMMGSALEHIQSDSPALPPLQPLPPQVLLNTESLLATLPSSTHFLLLPLNLRSYKPYVDSSSSAPCVPQEQLTQNLGDWFSKSVERLRSTIKTWFSDLQNAREVWNVRMSVLDCIESASGLDERELLPLKSVLDNACLERLLDIWKLMLKEAGQSFRDQVALVASSLANGDEIRVADTNAVEYLFQVPTLPSPSQKSSAHVSLDTSVQKYKATLQRQLMRKTAPVNEVLNILENCARSLQHDLTRLSSEDNESTRLLVRNFREGYKSDTKAFCANILDSLKSAADHYPEDTENVIHSLVFISSIANELATISPFTSSIDCENEVLVDFRGDAGRLCECLIDRWRQYTVSKIVREHWHSIRPPSEITNEISGPSSSLMQSLLSLSISIQQLGVYSVPSRQQEIVERTLRHFIMQLLNDDRDEGAVCWRLDRKKARSDIMVLRRIASFWGPEWNKISRLLEKKAATLHKEASAEEAELENKSLDNASEFLSRTQTLFSTLLPNIPSDKGTLSEASEKGSALLPLGVPTLDQDFQPAFRIAKPSSRFGLVLVGNEKS